MTYLEIVGDGAVFTTVRDLALWDRVFYGGFCDEELLETILTPGVLNSGESLDYAFGLGVTDYRGQTMVSHGGAFVGFRSDMIRFPELHFSVICLANCSSIYPSELCTAIADIYLEEVLEPEDGGLRYVGPGYRLSLAPVSETRFVATNYRDVEIVFGPAGESGQNSFRVFQGGEHRSTYLAGGIL